MNASTSLTAAGDGVADRIHSIVQEHPAIHFRGLKRAAEVSSNGQLRHHIDQLERENLLIELEDGGYTRFFITGQHTPELRRGLTRIARRVPRIISRLLLDGSMTRTDLRHALGCADSTLGYHLNRMLEQGVIQRDRNDGRSLYSLTDPAFIRRILDEFADIDRYEDLAEGSQNAASCDDGEGTGDPSNGTHVPPPIGLNPALDALEVDRTGDAGCTA